MHVGVVRHSFITLYYSSVGIAIPQGIEDHQLITQLLIFPLHVVSQMQVYMQV